ncbi:MAG: hypothetical protein IJ589_02580 [Lachnospiraceae bacterium]|nr:hypothetical protein [Lachnospiraceae bacterium]
MEKLSVSRFFADHMVLQQGKPIRVNGHNESGSEVTVYLMNPGEGFSDKDVLSKGQAVTDESGKWKAELPSMKAGGPLRILIRDDKGEEIKAEDVWIGEVWFCTGQSNMDLPMERVADHHADEVGDKEYPNIRTFRIVEHAEYAGPLEDPQTGTWVAASKDTIMQFGATAYFFGKNLQEMTDGNVAVGLIHASLGGSRIEGWMSREMLEGYDYMLEDADRYAVPGYMDAQNKYNEEKTIRWYGVTDGEDLGLKEGWEKKEDWSGASDLTVPCMFRDVPELRGFIGSIWLHRSFDLDDAAFAEAQAGHDLKLWMGTLVDVDDTYVNGVHVGNTPYQYPPRKYKVPGNILKKQGNHLVIRLRVEGGGGRVTPGKEQKLFNDKASLDLSGTWQYLIGMRRPDPMPPTDFVNWHPTGLYNGMTAACHQMAVRGVIWYQGESNTWLPESYTDLTKRQIEGYRKAWKEPELPYLFVQLPNFEIDQSPSDRWYEFREEQRACLTVPGTGMAVGLDLGEDNDLHPLEKREVGRRLALLAAKQVYGKDVEATGPVPEKAVWDKENGKITLKLSHAQGLVSMAAKSQPGAEAKGEAVTDFVAEDGLCNLFPCKVEKMDEASGEIVLSLEKRATPLWLRYCYSNTNKGALVYNGAGLPMTPFRIVTSVR